MYLLMFIPTGGLFNDREVFGGLPDQLRRRCFAIRLGVSENAAIAISHGRKMRRLLRRLSRSRDVTADFANFLSGGDEYVKRYAKSDLG